MSDSITITWVSPFILRFFVKIAVHKGLKDVGLSDYDTWEMAVHLLKYLTKISASFEQQSI